ncbi:MAG: nucleotidyltransferase family protein [Candidatus Omnitrophota bacterium]|nr:nucleotidyltransferase family protein [Candidatus Omnitrophota bacterium]
MSDSSDPLTACEEFVFLCSSYHRHPKEEYLNKLRVLRPTDWPRIFSLMNAHHLNGYLWFHLEPISKELPAEINRKMTAEYSWAMGKDFIQGAALEQLCSALSDSDLPFAAVKGPLSHRWIYGEIPISRGSADLDVLIFGEEKQLSDAVRIVESLDFRFQPRFPLTWQEHWKIDHDLPFIKTGVEENPIALELLRTPSNFHLKGDSAGRLLQWLRGQCRPVPWNSYRTQTAHSCPGLSPAGHIIYLSINLLKDGKPQIYLVNDMACLIERHGTEIDWEDVFGIAHRTGLTTAMAVSLGLVERFRGIRLPVRYRKTVLSLALGSDLQVPNVLRRPQEIEQGISGAEEIRMSLLNCPALAFGWGVFLEWWISFERQRARASSEYLSSRPLYFMKRIGVLPMRMIGILSRVIHGKAKG